MRILKKMKFTRTLARSYCTGCTVSFNIQLRAMAINSLCELSSAITALILEKKI